MYIHDCTCRYLIMVLVRAMNIISGPMLYNYNIGLTGRLGGVGGLAENSHTAL